MKKTNKIKNYSLKAKLAKKKKAKGFTLVELIVVIAIIGVLAVILVPNMMGRVKESKITTANDTAAKIAEQAGIIVSDLDVKGTTLDFTEATYTATYDSYTKQSGDSYSGKEFFDKMEAALPQIKGSDKHWVVQFDANGGIEAVVYGENGSSYVGTYPTLATDKAKNAIGSTADGSSTSTSVSTYIDNAKVGGTAIGDE